MLRVLQLLLDLQCMIQGHEWCSGIGDLVYCSNCTRTR